MSLFQLIHEETALIHIYERKMIKLPCTTLVITISIHVVVPYSWVHNCPLFSFLLIHFFYFMSLLALQREDNVPIHIYEWEAYGDSITMHYTCANPSWTTWLHPERTPIFAGLDIVLFLICHFYRDQHPYQMTLMHSYNHTLSLGTKSGAKNGEKNLIVVSPHTLLMGP